MPLRRGLGIELTRGIVVGRCPRGNSRGAKAEHAALYLASPGALDGASTCTTPSTKGPSSGHDDASAYDKTKDFAGKNVEIKGKAATKAGIKGIEVQSVKAV